MLPSSLGTAGMESRLPLAKGPQREAPTATCAGMSWSDQE